MSIKTTIYGYPKIGKNRELKKALESYWKKSITKNEFLSLTSQIVIDRFRDCLDAGIDVLASNDFSLYDFMLDTATMFDVIPQRFRDHHQKNCKLISVWQEVLIKPRHVK